MSFDDQSMFEEPQRGGGVARVLTALFMILTLLVFACYVAIFLNPYSPINPFPPVAWVPPSSPAEGQSATATVVPTFTPPLTFPPTWTPTLTLVPTATGTRRPTSTAVPPTPTWTPIPTATRPPQFALRQDPIFVETLYQSAKGWWTGVAGEVSDLDGNPVTDVVIRVQDNKGHSWDVVPGSAGNYAQRFGTIYGGGGSYAWWEQVLEGSCQQQIDVQVQLLKNGTPQSPLVKTKTTGDCNRGLVLVHFVKNW
jgi:hypothetical protein